MIDKQFSCGLMIMALLGAFTSVDAKAETKDASDSALKDLRSKVQKLEKALDGKNAGSQSASAEKMDELISEVRLLREDVDDLEDRIVVPEKRAGLDRIRWSGDFRFEVHSIESDIPTHINGLDMQSEMIPLLDSFNLIDLSDGLTFDELKSGVVGMNNMLANSPPALQEQFAGIMAELQQNARVKGYSFDDNILRTSRLRMRMRADVGKNVDFDGRLAMYKVWGDSTGVQIFNGQPTSINWDGTSATYPNSDDYLHVERVYFNWRHIAGSDAYVSIGRRPSTSGVPDNYREDEPRGGTPMGSLFNYQFDGITLGYHLNDKSTLRICYGVGYESGWGNGDQAKAPADRLDDAIFYGLVWDVWDTPSMYIHLLAAHAEDITDGFPATVVLPVDPVTGEAIPAPMVMRYTPSATIGNIDLAGMVITRRDGPVDYFVSYGYMETDPRDVTTPFGGMMVDPFDVPEAQSGNMFLAGARYNFNGGKTKLGLEFNHGSKYWYNFAMSEDDILSPKTSTRGDVWEMYLTHRLRKQFIFKANYIDYSYDYSGSGWLLGAPKELSGTPILGFPTYKDASVTSLSLTARF